MRERVAIVGTRRPTPAMRQAVINYVMEFDPANIIIVSGGAEGVDSIAVYYGETRGVHHAIAKPLYEFYHPKQAPLERNTIIAELCDRMVAFPGPESTGTWDAVRKARALGKPVEVIG